MNLTRSYFLISGLPKERPHENEIALNHPLTGQFERNRPLEHNRGDDYKPLVFPTLSPVSENGRRVRWPSERHSVHAIDVETVVNPSAIIVFPRSDSKSDNKLPTVQSAETPTTQASTSIAFHSHETNGTNEETVTTLMRPSVNISDFVANQTVNENELEPMIYIDDDGIFQVKYMPKGENISFPNADQQQSLASINETEEIAIISNDNRQILLDQHIHNETNTINLPSSSSSPSPSPTPRPTSSTTTDLIHDQPINNARVIHDSHNTNAESTSFKPDQQQQKRQQHQHQPLPDTKHPRLFNELPIFA